MKRFIALSLSVCIVFVLCACEREEIKKAERDAEAQRIINNANERRALDNYSEERNTNDKNAEKARAQAND